MLERWEGLHAFINIFTMSHTLFMLFNSWTPHTGFKLSAETAKPQLKLKRPARASFVIIDLVAHFLFPSLPDEAPVVT